MIELVVVLIVLGAAIYLVPMEPRIKTAAVVILLIFVALYLLGYVDAPSFPRRR